MLSRGEKFSWLAFAGLDDTVVVPDQRPPAEEEMLAGEVAVYCWPVTAAAVHRGPGVE